MRRQYKLLFVAHNGPGPWPCFFCDGPVFLEEPRFVVHHINHDRDDSNVENLRAAHLHCHSKFHADDGERMRRESGYYASPEFHDARRRGAATRKAQGNYQTEKHRAMGKVGGKRSTGRHVRWHVNRGIISDNCEFCVGS